MVKNIHIQINQKNNYTILDRDSLVINVDKYEPFDKLSKRFNRYTHKPKYENPEYDPKNYVLCLDDPNASYYTYIFYFDYPTNKIESVDIFFDSNDSKLINPLVFGFNQEDLVTTYYTYWHLINITYRWLRTFSQKHTLPSEGSFVFDDLLTRLIEELGYYVKGREKKFLIKLEKKVNGNESVTYPKTGFNKEKITLSKFTELTIPNYEKYVHVIKHSSNVESFYVSLHRNTVYFQRESPTVSIFLSSIDVYFEKHRSQNPVLFVFNCRNSYGPYVYKNSDFLNDVKKPDAKKLSELEKFQEDILLKTLIDEYDKANKTTTYLIYQKTQGYSSRIHIKLDYETNTKYKKYTHTSSGFAGEYSNILLKNGPFRVGSSSYVDKVTEVTAYFLKNKSGEEDDVPFLIEIKPDDIDFQENEYYSKSNDFEESWTSVICEDDELSTILNKIHIESDDFSSNRAHAYEILKAEFCEEEEDDDDEDDEDFEEEGDRSLGYKDLRGIVRSEEDLKLAVDTGLIKTPSGLEPIGPGSEEKSDRRQNGRDLETPVSLPDLSKVTDPVTTERGHTSEINRGQGERFQISLSASVISREGSSSVVHGPPEAPMPVPSETDTGKETGLITGAKQDGPRPAQETEFRGSIHGRPETGTHGTESETILETARSLTDSRPTSSTHTSETISPSGKSKLGPGPTSHETSQATVSSRATGRIPSTSTYQTNFRGPHVLQRTKAEKGSKGDKGKKKKKKKKIQNGHSSTLQEGKIEPQRQDPSHTTATQSGGASVGTIAGSTVGTVATVGTGVGVAAAVRPEWFIPVIRALV